MHANLFPALSLRGLLFEKTKYYQVAGICPHHVVSCRQAYVWCCMVLFQVCQAYTSWMQTTLLLLFACHPHSAKHLLHQPAQYACTYAGKPPCLVAVPTHFFKVVLAETKCTLPLGAPNISVGAFVMPNDQIQPDHPLTAFSVPLEMLENVAGAHPLFHKHYVGLRPCVEQCALCSCST